MTVTTSEATPARPIGLGSDRSRLAVLGVLTVGVAACPIAAILAGAPIELILFLFVTKSVPFFVAGAIGWTRRPDNATGPLLLAVAVCAGVGVLGLGLPPAFRIGRELASATATVLLMAAMLTSPAGRFSNRVDAVAFAVLATVLYGTLFVLRPLFFSGAEFWANQLVLGAISAGLSLVLLILVLRRWFIASGPMRRSLAPVAASGVLASVLFLIGSLSQALGVPAGPGTPIFSLDAVARALLPVGFLIGLLRLRMARIAIADLVTELEDLPAPRRLRDALASALRDPTLEVGYWSPGRQAYLAADGATVDLPAGGDLRAATRLERRGRPVGVILHDRALEQDPGLVAAVVAAVRLAIDNERLTAEVEAQLSEVRASRARIVEAGDAERKRIERDLHDGAQQRIVSMALALRLAQAKLGADADPAIRESIDHAAADAKAALSELRELARGLHPQVLSESGLDAAIEGLAKRASIDVSVDAPAGDRYPPAVERAAYFVVSEALANVGKYAKAEHAHVRIRRDEGVLAVEVTDDGIGGADPAAGSGLRGLADRLSAIDGTLQIESPLGAGTRLDARIPLAHDGRPPTS